MGEAWEDIWRKQRAALVASHDEGADQALTDATRDELGVDCTRYCYGGSATLDVHEVLATLAEAGWRLTRAAA